MFFRAAHQPGVTKHGLVRKIRVTFPKNFVYNPVTFSLRQDINKVEDFIPGNEDVSQFMGKEEGITMPQEGFVAPEVDMPDEILEISIK